MSEQKKRSEEAERSYLKAIDKAQRGDRLDFEDGLALYHSNDIWLLGRLVERVTFDRVGRNVYYSINRHINYTNICRINCRFCGFSRRPGQAGGYLMTAEEVVKQAQQAHQRGATEVHIVGGVHPELPLNYYREVIEKTHQSCPKLHIKAFTAVEIIDIAQKADLSVREILAQLKEAGLGSLPGGGAEILSEEYFRRACPDKPGPEDWLQVHATAHQLGLMTNATMLYGHIESPADRVAHMMKLRKLQDESLKKDKGRFQCFVPLPFIHPHEKPSEPSPESPDEDGTNVLTDLKTIAISRLMLDNIDHVKAFWPMLGEKLAQIALGFGANDLDGTVQQYRIVEKNRDNPTDSLSVEQIRALISETGRLPVQRDAFYRAI
ncbi:radical SAM protein [Planctomycetota bacterium]